MAFHTALFVKLAEASSRPAKVSTAGLVAEACVDVASVRRLPLRAGTRLAHPPSSHPLHQCVSSNDGDDLCDDQVVDGCRRALTPEDMTVAEVEGFQAEQPSVCR